MVKREKTNKKVKLNTKEEPPEEENPSAADMMKACGKTTLDQKTVYKTDIKVELKMKNGTARFNIRNAFITLMKQMQQVDPKAYFQSGVTKAYYKNPDKIPTGSTFSKAFVTKEDYKIDDPPLITITLKVLSNLCVNTIKYNGKVFNYIRRHACYICPDHFSRNNAVSPGMIFGVQDIMSITIEGLHPMGLNHKLTVSDKNVTIRDHILHNTNLIESMERTNKSEETQVSFLS
eukprot:1030048-Ditylum_brightwellii.AAC.1